MPAKQQEQKIVPQTKPKVTEKVINKSEVKKESPKLEKADSKDILNTIKDVGDEEYINESVVQQNKQQEIIHEKNKSQKELTEVHHEKNKSQKELTEVHEFGDKVSMILPNNEEEIQNKSHHNVEDEEEKHQIKEIPQEAFNVDQNNQDINPMNEINDEKVAELNANDDGDIKNADNNIEFNRNLSSIKENSIFL